MATKELVKLGWGTDSQSSKKLKGQVVKAGDISLDSGDGGCDPGSARVGDVQCIVLLCQEAARTVADQKALPLQVFFAFGMLLYSGI